MVVRTNKTAISRRTLHHPVGPFPGIISRFEHGYTHLTFSILTSRGTAARNGPGYQTRRSPNAQCGMQTRLHGSSPGVGTGPLRGENH
jgi:hypothetical protein